MDVGTHKHHEHREEKPHGEDEENMKTNQRKMTTASSTATKTRKAEQLFHGKELGGRVADQTHVEGGKDHSTAHAKTAGRLVTDAETAGVRGVKACYEQA